MRPYKISDDELLDKMREAAKNAQAPDDLEELEREVDSDPLAKAAYADARAREHLIMDLMQQRLALGMSQNRVALTIGTSQSTVSEWESGAVDPRLSSLQRYARAVGLRLGINLVMDDE